MRPVLELIERFANEIEYDLHDHLGLDLLDFFRGRYTWAKLWRLLNLLPWHSRYQLALADADDIAAAQLVNHDEQATPTNARPSLRNWDTTRELQATLTDGFNALMAVQAGKKARRPKPVPRPETAIERAKRRRDAATVDELFATFAPGR